MAKTSRRTWQKAEGRAAEIFGARRQPGSGSGGRDDQTSSDSTHPTLYLETKLRAKHQARTLHDTVKVKAKKENKIPVLMLADKAREGFLVCVHSSDMAAFVAAYHSSKVVTDETV